jgi:hypothetical protein
MRDMFAGSRTSFRQIDDVSREIMEIEKRIENGDYREVG